MKKNLKKITIGAALIALLLFSACGTGEPQEPTPDVNAIKTQAVQTAMAEMTIQAALSPSETPLPPTLTPLPTATLETGAAQPAGGSSSSSGSSSGGSSVPATPVWSSLVYKCEVINQVPWDGPQFTGAVYDVVWTLRNIGKVTWTVEDYYVAWFGPDNLSGAARGVLHYKLPHDVAVGQTVDIIADISIPKDPEIYPGWETNFSIINDNGERFCRFYYHVTEAIQSPTKTSTPTRVPH